MNKNVFRFHNKINILSSEISVGGDCCCKNPACRFWRMIIGLHSGTIKGDPLLPIEKCLIC